MTSTLARAATISNSKVLSGCEVAESVTQSTYLRHQVLKNEKVKVKVNDFLQQRGKSCKEIREIQRAAETVILAAPFAVGIIGCAAIYCVPASEEADVVSPDQVQVALADLNSTQANIMSPDRHSSDIESVVIGRPLSQTTGSPNADDPKKDKK